MGTQRDISIDTGAVCISRAKQSDATTAAALAVTLANVDKSPIINSAAPFYEILKGGIGDGNREPDQFAQGNTKPLNITLTHKEARPDPLALACAAFFGDPAAAAAIGPGYLHTGNMSDTNTFEQPYLTLMARRGGETQGTDKILLYGGQGESLNIKLDRKNAFISMDFGLTFLGKYLRNILRDVVYATTQGTSLTLSTHALEGSSAAERLQSIHAVIANLGGLNGRGRREITPTVASDATPAVLTIPAVWSALDQVYSSVSGTLTDYTTGAGTIIWDISTTDFVMIGSQFRFNALTYTNSVANDQSVTLDIEYFKSDGTWTNVAAIEDKTVSGGKCLAQTGDIYFTMPTDWVPCMQPYSQSVLATITKKTLYWIKVKATGPAKATTAGTIALSRYEPCAKVYSYQSSAYTDDTTDASDWTNEFPGSAVTTAHYIYFMADGTSCARILVEIGSTANDTAATTMIIEYWDGDSWASLVITDGTDAGGISLAQDGAVTWTQPTDHEQTTVNSVKGYWFRMSFDETLKAAARIQALYVGDRRIPFDVIYRGIESTCFATGATPPAEYPEPPFSIAGAEVIVNGRFNGTDLDGERVTANELISFEYAGKRNNAAPTVILDGSLDKYPKRHGAGNPTQTVKITREHNQLIEESYNRASNENSAVVVDDHSEVSIGLRVVGAVISATNTAVRYMFELIFPRAVATNVTSSQADGKEIVTTEYTIGEDTTNSYSSAYYKVINGVSASYAQ